MAELCRRYEVSRQTGYKWLERFGEGGLAAMADRSHTPMNRPHAMPESVREALVSLRRKHPSWGPKKLKLIFNTTKQ